MRAERGEKYSFRVIIKWSTDSLLGGVFTRSRHCCCDTWPDARIGFECYVGQADFTSLENLVARIHEDGDVARQALDLPMFAKYKDDDFLNELLERQNATPPLATVGNGESIPFCFWVKGFVVCNLNATRLVYNIIIDCMCFDLRFMIVLMCTSVAFHHQRILLGDIRRSGEP